MTTIYVDDTRIIVQCSAQEIHEPPETCPHCGTEDTWHEETMHGLGAVDLLVVVGCNDQFCEREIIYIHEELAKQLKGE